MTKKRDNRARAKAETFIAKIEGHGSLDVDFKKGSVRLNVHEGERLFEGILVGRTIEEMHWITPRICGVCPIAHNLASLHATEAALSIEVSETTVLLRRLMQAGQNIQSHVLHAVFLALPDYIGIDRITELEKKTPGDLRPLARPERDRRRDRLGRRRKERPPDEDDGRRLPQTTLKGRSGTALKRIERRHTDGQKLVALFQGLRVSHSSRWSLNSSFNPAARSYRANARAFR